MLKTKKFSLNLINFLSVVLSVVLTAVLSAGQLIACLLIAGQLKNKTIFSCL